MLTRPILETFATQDTAVVVDTLRRTQVLDTETGDAVLGYLAGNHPERYAAVLAMLDSDEVAA